MGTIHREAAGGRPIANRPGGTGVDDAGPAHALDSPAALPGLSISEAVSTVAVNFRLPLLTQDW